MEKDAAATQSQPASNVQCGRARGKSCGYVLVCGTIAGLVVGVLNVAAGVHGLKLKHFFDALDVPLVLAMRASNNWFGFWISGLEGDVYGFPVLIVVYWAFVGMFGASLFYVVRMLVKRNGVSRPSASDRGLSGE